MESNWRMNVALYGMQLSEWELCARQIVPTLGRLVVKRRDFTNWYFLYREPAPGQVPQLYAIVPIPTLEPSFPYGHLVFPD